jgi:hypothetical protein
VFELLMIYRDELIPKGGFTALYWDGISDARMTSYGYAELSQHNPS